MGRDEGSGFGDEIGSDAKAPGKSAAPFSWRPFAGSASARAVFLASISGTAIILAWIDRIRSGAFQTDFELAFGVLFALHDYAGALAALLILLAAILVPGGRWVRAVLRGMGSRPGAVAILTTIVMGAGAVAVYHRHPLSMDEYTQLFQSEAFAAGRLAGQFPPPLVDWLVPEQFRRYLLFLRVSPTGEVASSYLPTFSLLLTPFTVLGIPWMCNPVLSGLTILVLHRIAREVFEDDVSAGLTLLLTIASPVFFASGISYYSMTAHMLANATFAWLLLRPTRARLLSAGVVGSMALTLHNPLPHALFAVPWLVWVVLRRRRVGDLALVLAGYLPLSLLLGAGWYWYVNALIQRPDAATSDVAVNVTWPTVSIVLARLAGLSKTWLWATPSLVVVALMGAFRWRQNTVCRLLALSATITLAAYLFLRPQQGHGWGFRYFHPAWLALPLLAAAALAPRRRGSVPDAVNDSGLRGLVVACAVLSLVVGVGLRAFQIESFIKAHLSQLPQGARVGPRVVIIDPANTFYGVDLVQNDPFLRGDEVRLLSRGWIANELVMRRFFPDFERTSYDQYGEIWQPRGSTTLGRGDDRAPAVDPTQKAPLPAR